MKRYLLDTNVVSNLLKPTPSRHLLDWMAERDNEELHIASLTVGEIWKGILKLPAGRRRRDLQAWFNGPEGPPQVFQGRVLAFNQRAAIEWAELMAAGARSGVSRSLADMMIAATARVNDCVLVTDNERDFDDLDYINPVRFR